MREYCFLLMNIRKYVVFSLVTPGVYSSTDEIPRRRYSLPVFAPSLRLRRARAHRGVVRGLDPRHRAYRRHGGARRRRRRTRRAV